MKVFCFIFSIIAFIISVIYLLLDFRGFAGFEDILRFAIQFVLVMICSTGIIINVPHFHSYRRNRKDRNYRNMHA